MRIQRPMHGECMHRARNQREGCLNAGFSERAPSGIVNRWKLCSSSIQERWANRFLLAMAALVFAVAFYRIQMVVRWQLMIPFDLVFESPNLATIQSLRHGVNIYDPAFFNAHPFIFTLYTPLYHLICAALPDSNANPFLTGRLVALTFFSAAMVSTLWVANSRNWIATLLFLGSFMLLHPVASNFAFLKNDGTALFFSLIAVLTISRPSRTPRHIAFAALFALLAFAAKQVFLAATATCFISLLFGNRRNAVRFILYYSLFALVGAIAAQITWGNGFWWCVFSAPRLPNDPDQFRLQWSLMLWQPAFLFLLICSLFTIAEYGWRQKFKEWGANSFLLYLLFSSTVLLLTVGKPGSSTNYFIEPCLAAICWLISVFPSSRLGKTALPLTVSICIAAAFCEINMAKDHEFSAAPPGTAMRRTQLHKTLLKEAQALVPTIDRWRVLNLASCTTFFEWPGESAINDPYLYQLLWRTGKLKANGMVRELSAQTYDLVILRDCTVVEPDSRQDSVSQILRAIRESYHCGFKGDFLQYWVRNPRVESAQVQLERNPANLEH